MGARNGKASGESYRQGYPNHQGDDPSVSTNLEFYRGERECLPNKLKVDELHTQWWGDYETLEREHGYIQWLFPIREEGMNFQANMLMLHEREAIRESDECRERVRKSYTLFLDFLGISLVDEGTGAVERTPNFADRFHNLCTRGHNFLRITRVLKSLGELGFEHYQAPLVRFLAHETFETKLLAPCADSLANWWVHVVLDDTAREDLISFCAQHGYASAEGDTDAQAPSDDGHDEDTDDDDTSNDDTDISENIATTGIGLQSSESTDVNETTRS